MLVFAFDGSLSGDWIAHYAARFARNTRARALRLVHVQQASPDAHLLARIARISEECNVLGVALETELVPSRGVGVDVAARLLELVPTGATVIAGIRSKPRNSAFLAGTVTARLIDAGRFPVIAMRVAHPGVLGQPGRVLLPLAAHARSLDSALPIIRLLGEDLRELHVSFVREVSGVRARLLSLKGPEALLVGGLALIRPVEEALRAALAPHLVEIDSSIVISDDAPKEIVLQATRLRARLICLGAGPRTLPRRLTGESAIEAVLRHATSDVAIYGSSD